MAKYSLSIRKPNKLFMLYFTSFFVVILIPVFLMSISSYHLVIATVQEELSQANMNAIEQTESSLDRFLTQVNTLSIQLGLDGKVYAATRNPDSSYLLNDVKDRIKSLAGENMYIYSIQIYFSKNQMIFSSDGASRLYTNDSFDDWIPQIERSSTDELWIPSRTFTNHDGNEFEIFTLARKIPVAFPETTGYLAIHVYTEHLKNIVKTLDPQNRSNVFLIDSEGRSLTASSSNSLHSAPLPSHIAAALGASKLGYELDKRVKPGVLLTYGAPLFNHWVLMSETSLDYVYHKLAYVRQAIAFTGAILVLLGATVSFFLSRTMYNPIRQLLEKSRRYQKELSLPLDGGEKNDFHVVSGLFDNVVGKHKALEASYKANHPAMVDRFIYSVLFNKAGNAFDIDEKIKYLQLPVTNRHFIVMIVEIDDYHRHMETYSSEDRMLFRFALNNIVQELASANYPNLSTELSDQQIALLINLQNGGPWHSGKLRELAGQMIETVGRLLRFSITIGVGEASEDILQAHRSYEQASEVIKLKVLLGMGRILMYEDTQPEGYDDCYIPIQLEHNIRNNILAGNEENVSMYLRQLHEDISERGNISREPIFRLYHRMLDSAIDALQDHQLSVSDVFGPGYPIRDKLEEQETIDGIHGWAEASFTRIAAVIRGQAKNNGNVKAAVDYIETHYSEDLSVERIAEAVALNPAYLSRIFKQETGKTILEYLTVRRISESKKLLLASKVNIHEIAQSVGYNNTNSYIRFFRKYEGTTPGEYRKFGQPDSMAP